MSQLYELLDPDFTFEDNRGKLAQLVHGGYEQVNVLVTNQGVTRGGHYHKNSTEAFYVISGCVEIHFSGIKQKTEEKVKFEQGDFFRIHPYVLHSMFFPEDCVMVAMYDRCVEQENGKKDIHTLDEQ